MNVIRHISATFIEINPLPSQARTQGGSGGIVGFFTYLYFAFDNVF